MQEGEQIVDLLVVKNIAERWHVHAAHFDGCAHAVVIRRSAAWKILTSKQVFQSWAGARFGRIRIVALRAVCLENAAAVLLLRVERSGWTALRIASGKTEEAGR